MLPLACGEKGLSLSNSLLWKTVNTDAEALAETDLPYWVDVRDVADVHIRALLTPGADGQRFILAPHRRTLDDLARTANAMNTGVEVKLDDVDMFEIKSENCRTVLRKISISPLVTWWWRRCSKWSTR